MSAKPDSVAEDMLNVEIDGNIYHAPRLATEAPFRLYSDELGIEQSFDSLGDLVGSSVWSDSRIVYPPGWETNSIEAERAAKYLMAASWL